MADETGSVEYLQRVECGDARLLLIGAPGDGVEPSLLLTTGNNSAQYLFEVPEGFSRLALESKVRPTGKLRACFTSECSPKSSGGLTGLILRLAADGHERIAVVSSTGVQAEVDAARKCTRWVHPEVDAVELSSNSKHSGGLSSYADDSVTVWPLFSDDTSECLICEWDKLRRSNSGSDSDDTEKSDSEHVAALVNFKDGVNNQVNGGIEGTSVKGNASSVCLGYICEVKDRSNKPTLRFSVVNVRDVKLVDDMMTNPTIKCLCTTGLHAQSAMFHCTAKQIRSTDEYVLWAKSVECKHFACGVDDEIGFRASARVSIRLSTIDSDVFPIPRVLGNRKPIKAETFFTELGLCSCVDIKGNNPTSCIVDYDTIRPSDVAIEEVLRDFGANCPEFQARTLKAFERLRRGPAEPDIKCTSANKDAAYALKLRLQQGLTATKRVKMEHDPQIVFLGTGSAEPNKYRGSSGILVELPKYSADVAASWMLLDCGEGTVGSIKRLYGNYESMNIIAGLKMVWVSHHHADHMLGVRMLLDEHYHITQKPLTVVGPTLLREWLEVCGMYRKKYHFVHSRDLFVGPFGRLPPPPPPPPNQQHNISKAQTHQANCPNLLSTSFKTMESDMVRLTGLSRFEAVPVEHCRDAAALVVGSSTGWSLAYSGDCRPSIAFSRAAQRCRLMIHEATFDDNLVDHAIRKRHSTISEAMSIAKQASVQFIVLTHFSQRYPKAIKLDQVETQPVVAFDGMRLRCGQMEEIRSLQNLIQVAVDGRAVDDANTTSAQQ